MSTRRRFLRIAVLLLTGGVLAGVLVWRMMWIAPAWYRPPDVGDPQVVKLADDVEYRLIEEAHRPRVTGEQWTVRLREQHANAWLAARLRKWIAFEQGLDWPEAIGTPQVRFTPDGVDLACDVWTSSGSRYVTIRLVPHIENELIGFTISHMTLGRIAIGAASVDRMASLLAPEHRSEFFESEFGAILTGALTESASLDPDVRLSDGRRLRLRAIALHEAAVDLTFSTVDDE